MMSVKVANATATAIEMTVTEAETKTQILTTRESAGRLGRIGSIRGREIGIVAVASANGSGYILGITTTLP
jgi:hypothetical protein